MTTTQLWGRLLWKEWRESWPVLLICAIFPLLLLKYPKSGFFQSTSIALPSLLITLWAADRVRAGKSNALLPMPALMRWCFTYAIPAVIPMISGLLIGMAVLSVPNMPASSDDFFTGVVMFMLANFLLTTALAIITSLIPAVIIGVLLLFVTFDPVDIGKYSAIYSALVIASLLSTVIWEECSRKERYLLGRIMGILLIVVLALTSLGWKALFQRSDDPDKVKIGYSLDVTDGEHRIERTSNGYSLVLYDRYPYDDKMHWARYQQFKFIRQVYPLAAVSDHRLLILLANPRSKKYDLCLWNIRTHHQDLLTKLSINGSPETWEIHIEVSPDSRYVLFSIKSPLTSLFHDGSDLWVIDANRRKASLAIPDVVGIHPISYEQRKSGWHGDRVILNSFMKDSTAVINLKTLQGRLVKLPSFEGGTR